MNDQNQYFIQDTPAYLNSKVEYQYFALEDDEVTLSDK